MSIRLSLRGMLMLIRVDTFRRVHNVGFRAGRLISMIYLSLRRFNVIKVLSCCCIVFG